MPRTHHESADEKPYSSEFYEWLRSGSRKSAAAIVPHLVRWIRPRTVVDVGCGAGSWLAVFRSLGVTDVLGVDGDYVDRNDLEIPSNCFLPRDLRQSIALDRTFDLVVSVEVAEHIPAEFATQFVRSLVGLGPVILFSAAIPDQGGRHHVNEQWPDYWANLFREHGYVPVDCLRPLIWDNGDVEFWYAQNAILYVRADRLERYPELGALASATAFPPLSRIVHPNMFRHVVHELESMRRFHEENKVPRSVDGLYFASELKKFLYQGSLLPRLFLRAVGRRIR